MNASRFEAIAYLLKKHLNGELSAEETIEWEKWLSESPDNQELVNRLQDPEQLMQDLRIFYSARENILQKLKNRIPLSDRKESAPGNFVSKISFLHHRLLKYAAVLILILGLGGLWWMQFRTKEKTISQVQPVQDIIHPGTNKAVLTLGNGTKIILDESRQGVIAQEEGTNISVQDNQLSYQEKKETGSISFNTMSTPRGGQYRIVLQDGTAVWLNAQSSITYPVRFTEKERKVSITGEVYFEVARDTARPFIVDLQSQATIEVLGTHFNVNAYEEEASINTTLLEGSVVIRNGKYNQVLKPNQQARQIGDLSIQVAEMGKSGLNEVTAWKNGAFYFEEADLKTVMRQLARWYDFDIVYAGEIKEKFHLDLQRNTRIENVFRILEETRGVHFKIEGKKITAMPPIHP